MATLKKSVSVLALVAIAAFLFTFTIGCDDGGDSVVIEPITVTEGKLAATWKKAEAVGDKYRTYASDYSYSEFLLKDTTVSKRVSGTWSLSGNDITITPEAASTGIEYKGNISNDTLKMTIGTTEEIWVSSAFPDTGGTIVPPDTNKTVTFDDFGIHKFGTDDADTGYTNLSSVGHQLADYLDGESDLTKGYPGGSEWYAYCSENGARVYVYGENDAADLILDGAETTTNDMLKMEKMQGDDSLTVVFDCRDSLIDKNILDYYYAGVGISIGGVKDSLGATLTPLAEVVGDNIYWDFSGIESISIKGTIQGSVVFFFEYKTDVASPWGYHAAHVAGEIDAPTVIDTTLNLADFTPNASGPLKDLNWDDHKGAVSAFVIELDTDASVGGDFAIVKLDDIKFNFTTAEAKSDALPWLE